MDTQFSVFESFSAATGISTAVLDKSGDVCFSSAVHVELAESLLSLFSAIGCEKAERSALTYGFKQSSRFGGRYIFLAPSGLSYCVSPLAGAIKDKGVAAGPFLMVDYDDYLDVDVSPWCKSIDHLTDVVRMIPFRSPTQARGVCELLALCAEHCHDLSGPFSVPFNEALAASVKHMDVIAKAIAYIQQNYMKKITLQDIADHVFLSTTYFSKVFREETGQTPGNFITAIRIDESKRLLRALDVNIVNIPEISGFENQSYFTRVFKKYEGMTPGEYRRRNQ